MSNYWEYNFFDLNLNEVIYTLKSPYIFSRFFYENSLCFSVEIAGHEGIRGSGEIELEKAVQLNEILKLTNKWFTLEQATRISNIIDKAKKME